MAIGPVCPRCGKLAPFLKTQWNVGKPFTCEGCAATLAFSKARAGALGLGLLTAFLLLKGETSEGWGPPALFVGMLVVGLPLTWLLNRPRVV